MTTKTGKLDDGVIDMSALGKGLDDMTPEELDAFLQEGLDDIEAGRVVDHEVVVAEMEAWRASRRAG